MKAISTFLSALFFNLIAPFRSFNGLQWVSLVLGLSSLVMANADLVKSNPWLPGWFVAFWPHVLIAAGIFARYGHLVYPQVLPMTAAQIQQAVTAHLQTPAGQATIQAAVVAQNAPPLTP